MGDGEPAVGSGTNRYLVWLSQLNCNKRPPIYHYTEIIKSSSKSNQNANPERPYTVFPKKEKEKEKTPPS
jgi:hypothetical protein